MLQAMLPDPPQTQAEADALAKSLDGRSIGLEDASELEILLAPFEADTFVGMRSRTVVRAHAQVLLRTLDESEDPDAIRSGIARLEGPDFASLSTRRRSRFVVLLLSCIVYAEEDLARAQEAAERILVEVMRDEVVEDDRELAAEAVFKLSCMLDSFDERVALAQRIVDEVYPGCRLPGVVEFAARAFMGAAPHGDEAEALEACAVHVLDTLLPLAEEDEATSEVHRAAANLLLQGVWVAGTENMRGRLTHRLGELEALAGRAAVSAKLASAQRVRAEHKDEGARSEAVVEGLFELLDRYPADVELVEAVGFAVRAALPFSDPEVDCLEWVQRFEAHLSSGALERAAQDGQLFWPIHQVAHGYLCCMPSLEADAADAAFDYALELLESISGELSANEGLLMYGHFDLAFLDDRHRSRVLAFIRRHWKGPAPDLGDGADAAAIKPRFRSSER